MTVDADGYSKFIGHQAMYWSILKHGQNVNRAIR